jgi:L-tartrate/succinate antiporter
MVVPLLAPAAVAALPAPSALPQHAWYFFAIFLGAVLALVLEPLPNAAVGLIAVAACMALSRWVLFGPSDLARPGFEPEARALEWGLSGFRNPAVWLAFSAFMFGLGYEKTGLGRRIALWIVRSLGRSTLRLGYAVALVDAVLAPFTPSNTARSAGMVYPIIRGVPLLYGSEPHRPSARRMGSYLLWTAFAASCVTSSLFLTALAPNLIAVDMIRRMANVDIGWLRWLAASATFGVPLLALVPLLGLVLYPPEIKSSPEVPLWAADELERLGPLSRDEVVFALLVFGALGLWVLGGSFVHPTTVAFLVIGAMLVTRIATWEEMAGHGPAWDMLFRLGTLVALADGLTRTGFVGWFAGGVARHLAGLHPTAAAVALVAVYFLSHYMFATTTAHATAVLPVMLGVGLAVPGLPMGAFTMLLAFSHGLMGVLSPYATGPAPVYHGSGYLPTAAFWRLGAIFGAVFLAFLLLVGLPAALALAP